MKQKKIWIFMILCGLAMGTISESVYAFPENVQKDRPAKDFSLKDLQSKRVSLSDFRGKVVLLNFFATWCAPCRQEIPELIKLYQQYKPKGLEIVGISLDSDDFPFLITNFVKKMKISYPVLIGTEEVVEAYNVFGVPITVIIDKEGRIYKRFDGLVPPRYFEITIKELLEARSKN